MTTAGGNGNDGIQPGKSRWRSAAEKKIGEIAQPTPPPVGQITTEETQFLLHELQTHQIELEMQNDELNQAKDALEDSRARFVSLFDLAPIGYCTVAESGKLIDANLRLASLLAVPRSKLQQQLFTKYVRREHQDAWYLFRAACFANGATQSCELGLHDTNRKPFWAQLSAKASQTPQGTWELHIALRDASTEKAMQEQLLASEERYRTLANDMPLYVSAFLPDGTLSYVNMALAKMAGTVPERLIGSNYFDFLGAAERSTVKAKLLALTPQHSAETHEQHWTGPDGQIKTQEWTNRAFFDSAGKLVRLQAVGQEITERKRAEAQILLASKVFSHAREGIMITDAKGSVVDINEAFTHITGYSHSEAVGQNPRMLNSGRQDPAFYTLLWESLTGKGHWSGEIWNRHKDGAVYAVLLTISSVRDTRGQTQQYVALYSDISAIKAHQSELEHLAHFDALTHLPNRLLLADRLQQSMAQAKRSGQMLAVAYLDLDGFKNVNDQHGHDVGDKLLMRMADAMKSTLRMGETLARIGGDEFVAVFINLDSVADCVPMLTRLLEAAAAQVVFGDLVLQGSASIGVTFYPKDNDVEADQLLRQADQAMYQAKMAGKNRYHVFDSAQDSSMRIHHVGLARIQLALDRHEFVLHYQPKVNMRKGTVVGVEALIRWQHPEKGLLSPATFLPLIEDHPIAVAVGEWVIDTALSQMEAWHAAGPGFKTSVNIGARQLLQSDFVERLKAILAKHPQIKPGDLELEILETSALADMAQASQVIEDCSLIGVRCALDDFGTGYSSLAYLKRLRVSQLKIDQSFVRDMLNDPDDMAILESVIGLAAAFKREVIAEGVETVEHGTVLLQLGCELGQGFGIARPMPAEAVAPWAANWQPDAAWRALQAPLQA